jgi:hypothetical protein
MGYFEPVRAEPAPALHRHRDWARYTDGSWWKFRDEPDDVLTADAYENKRITTAARNWAQRRDLRVESRTERAGKVLYLRFLPRR